MFAPTASQMLRDDQKLRNLHRETLRRRKRFEAKQKKLQDDEEHRRINALQRRRQQRNRHLSGFRKNNHQNSNHHPPSIPNPPRSHRRRHSHHQQQAPIRVHHNRTRDRGKNNQISANNDELQRFIVPVCDQLPSPNLSSPSPKYSRNKKYKSTKKSENKRFSNHNHTTNHHKLSEKKTDFEFNDKENQHQNETQERFEEFPQNEISDQLSIAELDDFEKKHFGMQQSIDTKHHQNKKIEIENAPIPHNNYSKQPINLNLNPNPSKSGNGYQTLFHKKINYENETQKSKYLIPSNQHKQNINITQSINGSLFSINDADMKTPEDNDSVKINPKDSIDCSKMDFSTVYNSNLLPLQSALDNKQNILNNRNQNHPKHTLNMNLNIPRNMNKSIISNKTSISHQYQYQHKNRIQSQIQQRNMMRNYLYPTANPPKSKQSQRSLGHSQISSTSSYGIRLPRLTQSILKEKDRLDSKHLHSPKSTFSAPVWNLGYNGNMAQNMNQRRKPSTIIDDFFTKTSDEFAIDSHRKSNNTMFLPNINRSRLKPKGARYSKFNKMKQNTAYSVISEYDIIKEEDKLKKSLKRINETLSNLKIVSKSSTINKHNIKFI